MRARVADWKHRHARVVRELRPPPPAPAERHERALRKCLNEPLVGGNRVEVLVDGPATYEAMFAAIDAARDHINIESYIVEAEGPGQELARRLIEKRRQGVKVHLLFDHFGSLQTASSYFDALREAGVQMCCFNPLRPSVKSVVSKAMHLRDHRKLLIVDGRIAFTGGVNIACVHAQRPGEAADCTPWRDTHVRIEGPVVARLQKLFLDHWTGQTGQRPRLARYFPPLAVAGTQQVAVAACDAGRRRNPFYTSLLRAIELAQHRVCITAAYFVPPRRLLRALAKAAARGVEVRLVLPSISDSRPALYAGRSHYSRLLRAGVRIFERQDALLHAKTAVIDGVWATVGSSNMDWRSFLHNAEANVILLDEGFAQELEGVFANDLSHSVEIRPEQWRHRGFRARLLESLARKFEFFL
jgi:cardiolipin synthase